MSSPIRVASRQAGSTYPAEAATVLLPPACMPPANSASVGPLQTTEHDHLTVQCNGSSVTLPYFGAALYLDRHAHEPLIPDLPPAVSVPRKGSAHRKLRVEELRERRMVSNRESARRSLARRQIQLGQHRAELPHLRDANRLLLHRLDGAGRDLDHMVCDNVRLREEQAELRRRLWELHVVGKRVAVGDDAESRMVAAAIL